MVKLHKEKLFDILAYTSVCAGGLLFLCFAGMYLKLSQQFIVGWGLLGLLIFFNRIESFKRPPMRIIIILMVAFISIRYWFWRTFDTLIYTSFFDLVGMLLLYFAEGYVLTIHFLGLYVNSWPLKRKILPLPDDYHLYPTVDILIPTYLESEEIVKVTVTACTQVIYPKDKLNIYILDDGSTIAKRNDPEASTAAWKRYYSFKRMARELGVNYLTRESNKHAKAGNINHALHHANGDLMLLLDCDHVPTRDILKNTVGWFLKDKKLFLVQTPHFFINPNPLEKNLAIFDYAPSENEMFYRSIQSGLDFWNSSFFCGSAAILRREHIEKVGGFSGDTITEDAETTLSLHDSGYNSIYVDRPMVCGLSPESFDDFIIQRSRWTQGMLQIFILKNPLLKKGMKIYQRLCYLSCSIFWFFCFSRFIFYIIPTAFLLFGLKVYHASFVQVAAYALPHVMACIIVTDFLHGKVRWAFFSELYESVQSIFLIPVIYSVIMNPRAPVFKVTPKGKRLEDEFLSPMVVPYFILVFIIAVSILVAVVKWFTYPLYRDVIIITFSWSVFNLFLALASLGVFLEKKQVRRQHRIRVKETANIFIPRLNQLVQGEIKDISLTGMALELSVSFPLKPDEEIILAVRDIYGEKYRFGARVYRNTRKNGITFCGCNFISHGNEFIQLVKFVYGNSQRWENFWEKKAKHANALVVLFLMVRLGVKGSKNCFVSLLKLAFTALKKLISDLLTYILTFWKVSKKDLAKDC